MRPVGLPEHVGSYGLAVEPKEGKDHLQMQVMTKYLKN